MLSAAVSDRALFVQTLGYEDVTDDDLQLFIETRADIEQAALALILKSFRGPRTIRSLRRVGDLVADGLAVTDGGRLTPDAMRHVLEVA